MTKTKNNTLGDVIDAYNQFESVLNKHRNLKKDIAAHISSVLPDGIAFEWFQSTTNLDGFAVFDPVILPEKIQVLKNDHLTTQGLGLDPKDPTTEWIDTEDTTEVGYFVNNGIDAYQNDIPGLTKKQLREVVKTWKQLPVVLLDRAFGDAVVRVLSNGKITVKEN